MDSGIELNIIIIWIELSKSNKYTSHSRLWPSNLSNVDTEINQSKERNYHTVVV